MTRKIIKWAVVAAILISLATFIYKSDLSAILDNIKAVGLNFLWLIVITFLAQICGTLSWMYTLPRALGISFSKLFVIRYIGEHIGLINPTNIVGGDAFKAYQLEKLGVSYKKSISSILMARLIMIYIQVVIFIIAAVCYLFYIIENVTLLYKVIGLSFVFIALTIGVLFLSDRLFRIQFFQKKGISKKVSDIKSAIYSYYTQEKSRFLNSILWSGLNFLVGAIEIWLICHFIGIKITYLEALLIDQGVLFLKSFGAFVPGQVGVEEYTNKVMLTIVGISSLSVWISVSILRRARQIFWILLAIIVYYWTGMHQRREAPESLNIQNSSS